MSRERVTSVIDGVFLSAPAARLAECKVIDIAIVAAVGIEEAPDPPKPAFAKIAVPPRCLSIDENNLDKAPPWRCSRATTRATLLGASLRDALNDIVEFLLDFGIGLIRKVVDVSHTTTIPAMCLTY
jgi:hypothetical protein